ncbi:MAG: hypothetical protein KC431_27935, partial [Myxococcales bacterium]|nr:hypothetical protein [Myxococcales bacterium]
LQLGWARAQIEIGQFAGAAAVLEGLESRWPGRREPLIDMLRVLRDVRDWSALQERLEAALAGPFAGDGELAALLAACRTWRGGPEEGGEVRSEARNETMRERLLEHEGVVLLGTGHDDGLAIPWYSTYLCSNDDVIVTCGRLLGAAAQLGWRWQAVVAIDPAAAVLAEILAVALELPADVLGADEDRDRFDPETTLAVASFLAPGWQLDPGVHGPWARRCAEAGNLFAFGVLDWHAHLREPGPALPPIVGIAGGERLCLPWWRLGEARIGFSRHGLIDDLPPEIDGRTPARIAADHHGALADFDGGPGFALALRALHGQREHMQAGLRRRSDFARIPAATGARRTPSEGSAAAFVRALAIHERAPERIDDEAWQTLEARFVATPDLRPRLADLLYRVDPARLTALLHRLLDRPPEQVLETERNGLLRLLGCDPWGSQTAELLARWLDRGSVSDRSEIVQSKYG